jgi:hypothetical protein
MYGTSYRSIRTGPYEDREGSNGCQTEIAASKCSVPQNNAVSGCLRRLAGPEVLLYEFRDFIWSVSPCRGVNGPDPAALTACRALGLNLYFTQFSVPELLQAVSQA